MGIAKRKVSQLWYRLKIRKELGNLDKELLVVTYEEAKKEIERRNREK